MVSASYCIPITTAYLAELLIVHASYLVSPPSHQSVCLQQLSAHMCSAVCLSSCVSFLICPWQKFTAPDTNPQMWSSAESDGNLSRTWQETSCRGHQNKVKNTNGSQTGFFLFKQIFDASFNFGLKCDLDTVDFLHSYCWQTHLLPLVLAKSSMFCVIIWDIEIIFSYLLMCAAGCQCLCCSRSADKLTFIKNFKITDAERLLRIKHLLY